MKRTLRRDRGGVTPNRNGPRRSWRTRSTGPCRVHLPARRSTCDRRNRPKQQSEEGEHWDLIIVDPAVAFGPDFLDAPKRLGSFLDGRLIRVSRHRVSWAGDVRQCVLNASLVWFASAMSRILRAQCCAMQKKRHEFSTPVQGFQRAEQTYVVTAGARHPLPGGRSARSLTPLREASYFVQRLESERMPLAGPILNQAGGPADPSAATRAGGAAGDEHTLCG